MWISSNLINAWNFKFKKRTIDANILGTKCRWSLGGEFWYIGRRWSMWNIETTNEEWWR